MQKYITRPSIGEPRRVALYFSIFLATGPRNGAYSWPRSLTVNVPRASASFLNAAAASGAPARGSTYWSPVGEKTSIKKSSGKPTLSSCCAPRESRKAERRVQVGRLPVADWGGFG